MGLIFGKDFSSKFGLDFLDTGEVGLEALGEGLHKLVFGDAARFLILGAHRRFIAGE